MQSYDLIVIGSGPAGQRAAIQGAKFGKGVAVVERRECIGGACINTGTIPSKTLREAVMHLSGYAYQGIYGVNYRVKDKITMADLAFRVQHVIKTEIDVTVSQLSRNGVSMLYGSAKFLDPHTLRIESLTGAVDYRAENIVIATGTKPAASPKVPYNNRNIINSDQILNMPEIPKTFIVVGGGVIGVEFTCMFAALGVRMILVEKRPRLLEFADGEMVEALSYHLRDTRVTMRLNEEVSSVEEMPDGSVVANLESNKKITGSALLYAVGRQGNVDELNLEAAGLDADDRGRIKVDADFRTKVPHIFAAGDVIGFPSLASTSMEQGRIAACHAFGAPMPPAPEYFPYGIYAVPEISTVGLTEQEVKAKGMKFEVGIGRFRETSRGHIMGLQTGMMKMLFSLADRRLLGVHIIGEGATELIHIGQAVLNLGGTVDYFVENAFNYPTLAEAYKIAALDAFNRMR